MRIPSISPLGSILVSMSLLMGSVLDVQAQGLSNYAYTERAFVGKMAMVQPDPTAEPKKPIALYLWTRRTLDVAQCELRALEDLTQRRVNDTTLTTTVRVLDASNEPNGPTFDIRVLRDSVYIEDSSTVSVCDFGAKFEGRWSRVRESAESQK